MTQLIAANNEVFEEVYSNKTVKMIENNFQTITDYIKGVKSTLDEAVHGHDNAKQQIECIIAQWITGEQDGHCFGFEGSPGLGKTSMAKRGLANCLKDSEGNSRPFAFIQMGGDSNGSTLHGHNYTYVGSTWGSIVQILMDKKCMNPIIFIDEIDKISKTEHGREIIGILTHLFTRHMLKIISTLFGGSKSEKDVKKIQHLVGVINGHFEGYRALDNDQLRAKTLEFKARIKTQTKELDSLIEAEQNKAEALSEGDLMARDAIYQNIDTIKKDRDQEIEKVLWEILPEAYAVVKEAARRFTNEEELITTATNLDRELAEPEIRLQLIDFVRAASYSYWDWVADLEL